MGVLFVFLFSFFFFFQQILFFHMVFIFFFSLFFFLLSITFINRPSFPCFMQHKQKSRTFARRQVRTPGARVVTHYVKRKPNKAHCAVCGAVLKGVPRELPSKMRNLAKTEKRPERPYGGVLCSACMREKMKELARN